MIDAHVSLGDWPTRRPPDEDPGALVRRLRRNGVTQAWTGSLEGLLHKDIAAVNERLATRCREFGRGVLMPFGTINPLLPDWDEELRRCVERHRMAGIRLYPNYHGYRLDDGRFEALLRAASDRGLLVQIALSLEDERMMHPLLWVQPVETRPLLETLQRVPAARVLLLGAFRSLRGKALLEILATRQTAVEISTLDGVGGLGVLLGQVSLDQVLFGSNAPQFYFEASLLKLQESELSLEQRASIRHRNARRWLSGRGI